jgi:hypothetical protein
VTLYITPVLYVYLDRLGQRLAGKRRSGWCPHRPNKPLQSFYEKAPLCGGAFLFGQQRAAA